MGVQRGGWAADVRAEHFSHAEVSSELEGSLAQTKGPRNSAMPAAIGSANEHLASVSELLPRKYTWAVFEYIYLLFMMGRMFTAFANKRCWPILREVQFTRALYIRPFLAIRPLQSPTPCLSAHIPESQRRRIVTGKGEKRARGQENVVPPVKAIVVRRDPDHTGRNHPTRTRSQTFSLSPRGYWYRSKTMMTPTATTMTTIKSP